MLAIIILITSAVVTIFDIFIQAIKKDSSITQATTVKTKNKTTRPAKLLANKQPSKTKVYIYAIVKVLVAIGLSYLAVAEIRSASLEKEISRRSGELQSEVFDRPTYPVVMLGTTGFSNFQSIIRDGDGVLMNVWRQSGQLWAKVSIRDRNGNPVAYIDGENLAHK